VLVDPLEELHHAFRPFCEHLERMPGGGGHDSEDAGDGFERNRRVKQVAHAVHEDHPRLDPPAWLIKLVLNEFHFSIPLATLGDQPLIGFTRALESVGHGFRVAVAAAFADS
jgi:hypothetical protein